MSGSFRNRRSDPFTKDEEAVNSGSPKGMFGDRQPAVYLIKNNSASRSDDDGSAARDGDDNSAVHGDDATAACDYEGFAGRGEVWATARV